MTDKPKWHAVLEPFGNRYKELYNYYWNKVHAMTPSELEEFQKACAVATEQQDAPWEVRVVAKSSMLRKIVTVARDAQKAEVENDAGENA